MSDKIIKGILFFMCSISIACNGNSSAGGDAADAAQKHRDSLALKVGVSQRIDCLPAFYAESEGVFDSLGVSVKIVHYTSLLDCDASLRKRTIDGAFTDEKRVAYLKSHDNVSLSNIFPTDMQWQLVASRKSRVQHVSQLTDKLVAMTRFSATDYFCDLMTDSMKSKDKVFYRIQVNDVDLRLKMLLNNEIDAAWLPEPQASVAIRAGGNVIMKSGRQGENLSGLFFFSGLDADGRKGKQIKIFVKAYEEAMAKIAAMNRTQYTELISRYYKYNNVGK